MSNTLEPPVIAPRAQFWLKATVFVSGLAGVGAQTAASRLVAPYFGNSTIIWATLIGLTLAYLSLGYALGGQLADRFPHERLFYGSAILAAVAIALIPVVAPPLMIVAIGLFAGSMTNGAFYGALLTVGLLFLGPVTLLGCLSPMALRLRMQRVSEAGGAVGTIYALSTLGSIAGAFLPVLLLLPYLGTRATFAILAGLLGGCALLAWWLGGATRVRASLSKPGQR